MAYVPQIIQGCLQCVLSYINNLKVRKTQEGGGGC